MPDSPFPAEQISPLYAAQLIAEGTYDLPEQSNQAQRLCLYRHFDGITWQEVENQWHILQKQWEQDSTNQTSDEVSFDQTSVDMKEESKKHVERQKNQSNKGWEK